MGECKSYRRGALICADGFPQKAYCAGHLTCEKCGTLKEEYSPLCLREITPKHLINEETGAPMLYVPIEISLANVRPEHINQK